MSEVIRGQRIIESTSITEVVGEYLQLRGDGFMLQSVCPFPNDHLSTFRLDPVARSFKCSACGAAGDVVYFVRK
jgi:DNA primase